MKRRTKKVSASLAYKLTAPIGITETINQSTRRRASALERWKRTVHDQVWARDPCCRVSGRASEADQMHEDPSRAQTRGKPPAERFNTKICIRLAPWIHRLVTENKIVIVKLDPAKGFNGPITWGWAAFQSLEFLK